MHMRNLAMGKMRVFVVDDDRDFGDSLAEAIRLDGHTVDVAYSGEEAIEKFRQCRYDVTLMDVRLPGMNGVESFLKIRALQPDAQVYMMTAYSVEQLLDEAIAHGARGVLMKPLDVPHVLHLIRTAEPEGILVADDDPDFVESIEELLKTNGYSVFTAHDGRAALNRVLDNGIDVLILDLCMPLMSGLEVYIELKRLGRCLPTIIVTAYAAQQTAAIDKLQTMRVTGILTKPFDPAELLRTLATLGPRKRPP